MQNAEVPLGAFVLIIGAILRNDEDRARTALSNLTNAQQATIIAVLRKVEARTIETLPSDMRKGEGR